MASCGQCGPGLTVAQSNTAPRWPGTDTHPVHAVLLTLLLWKDRDKEEESQERERERGDTT